MLRAGNLYVEVFEYCVAGGSTRRPRPPGQRPRIHALLPRRQDIDAEYERLSGVGMRFHCPAAARVELGGGSLRPPTGATLTAT